MRYRKFPNTNIKVSEVGFGMWTVSTGWWGKFTESEAIRLMHKAFDLGINLFDAADTYGEGLSEELIAKAFPKQREQLVIATKVGYDFYNHSNERKGQRELPQDFSGQFIRFAVDQALKRLKTDHIDMLQLHNIRMEQVETDEPWDTLKSLQKEGKILAYGAALGPAIGWLYEGKYVVQRRNIHVLQHIWNLLEQFPGNEITEASRKTDTMFLIRVTHSSGMLEGKYTEDTVFPAEDHRSHRPRSWLLNGLKKIKTLEKLHGGNTGRTLGQVAIKWLLAEPKVASTLPNIYNEEQLVEFAKAPEVPDLTREELDFISELAKTNFGVAEEKGRYKGTMEEPAASASV